MADEISRVALCAGAQDAREEQARMLFREAWKVPVDTYITDGFPLLMTRLGLIPGREATGADRDTTPRS